MAINKMLFTLTIAIGLINCVTALQVKFDEKNYHFGSHRDGDVILLKNETAKEKRHTFRHRYTPTFVIPMPDKKTREKLKIKEEDTDYIPTISEIIVKDQGSGSRHCRILNGGIGKRHVTLKFISHAGGKINYKVTITGQ